MIPKVIHYCWFGGSPIPDKAIKCIESWKRFCPDYEIKKWNESNYDLCSCEYTKEAARVKKWAFVSDYARFDILYRYGGLYFDTDVELIKSIDDIVEQGAFMGLENCLDILNAPDTKYYMVNPGLGISAEPGMQIILEILKMYAGEHYLLSDEKTNTKTVLDYTTHIFEKYGFKGKNKVQIVGGVTVYPAEYFCPMNYSTGVITITGNTRSIHHYDMSWKSAYEQKMKKIERYFRNHLGNQKGWCVYRVITLPIRVLHKMWTVCNSSLIKIIKKVSV